MFSTVRYFIKTSIVFLILGMLTGLHIMLSEYLFHTGYGYSLVSAHTHIILVGSVMMMIMGVALWFFPRPEKEDKRYNPDLIRFTYFTMTAFTALRFLVEVGMAYVNLLILTYLDLISGFGQIASMILFFYSIWGRIRPIGSAIREAKGEKF
ncbi:MAG: hypothetical protein ACP5US_02860 [Candidatus Kryptoniota bacterium]